MVLGKNSVFGASEIALKVKVFAAKSEDLTLIPRNNVVGGEN